MREFNEFQNESFEKEVMVEKQPEHETEERPKVERPKHEVEERPKVERPKHEVEEGPKVERPKHEVEERPRVERPKHKVEERPRVERPRVERPRVERPRSVEEKIKFIISFIINFSTDKNQLLELRKILVELEFNEKEERKEMLENHERKIRRR